jgi:hypothetical protein
MLGVVVRVVHFATVRKRPATHRLFDLTHRRGYGSKSQVQLLACLGSLTIHSLVKLAVIGTQALGFMSRRSAASQKSTPAPVQAKDSQTPPLVDISEEEQWRLINQSGVLKKVAAATQSPATQPSVAEPSTLGDELFNTALYTIPVSSLLLLMEMYVAYLIWTSYGMNDRYGQTCAETVLPRTLTPRHPRQDGPRCAELVLSWGPFRDFGLTEATVIAMFTFYTLRHNQKRLMQLLLLVFTTVVGNVMVQTVNRANWKIQMQRVRHPRGCCSLCGTQASL